VLDRKSGEFVREGNIYNPAFEPDLKISETYPLDECPAEARQIFVSRGARERTIGADAIAKLPPVGQFELGVNCKFAKRRGAILIMHNPRKTEMTFLGNLLPKLRDVKQLSDKALVTSVFSAPSYALLLTEANAKGGTVVVTLALAVPGNSEVQVGTHYHWDVENFSGVSKHGPPLGEVGPFYPLYTLKTPKSPSFLERLRGIRGRDEENIDGEDAFYPYQVPWNIDEDGNEDEDGEEDEA